MKRYYPLALPIIAVLSIVTLFHGCAHAQQEVTFQHAPNMTIGKPGIFQIQVTNVSVSTETNSFVWYAITSPAGHGRRAYYIASITSDVGACQIQPDHYDGYCHDITLCAGQTATITVTAVPFMPTRNLQDHLYDTQRALDFQDTDIVQAGLMPFAFSRRQ